MSAAINLIVPMNRQSGHPRTRNQRRRWSKRGALTPPSPEQGWQEAFHTELTQLETAVESLRDRFNQIQSVQQQQQQVEQQLQAPGLDTAEVKRLKQQLDELEVQLESALFDWRSLQEPFWQAVRFGGIGIVIGWILRWLASG